ncbi:hypothetical protein [Tenacibaculum sp. 190524A05c]|uniref:hypothetical protein n=1 Tax=Tenacibaculum platacis TaxID=3137852 RepID=UPI0031FAF9D1
MKNQTILHLLQLQAITATYFSELCHMYREYFSKVVKAQGAPNLNADQFIRYQNIIAIDYFIGTIKAIGVSHSLFQHVSKAERTLKRLTKELEPEELLKEMIELSV